MIDTPRPPNSTQDLGTTLRAFPLENNALADPATPALKLFCDHQVTAKMPANSLQTITVDCPVLCVVLHPQSLPQICWRYGLAWKYIASRKHTCTSCMMQASKAEVHQ